MKQVQKLGARQLTIADVPQPRIVKPSDVKIQVHYAAICTNDLMLWEEQLSSSYANNGIGHEFSGVITELGEEAMQFGLAAGDRVSGLSWEFCGKCPYCRAGKENMCINLSTFVGAMTESIVIEDRMVCVLPDNISLEEGCLTEVVSTCLHGINRTAMEPGASVLILGGGVSGQIMVQLAQMRGAGMVALCDRIQSKRLLAQKLGATYVIDHQRENLIEFTDRVTHNLGFEVIINISHDPAIVSVLPGLLAKGGSLLLFTQYKPNETATLNLAELYVKECVISTAYMAPYLLDKTMRLLPKLNLKSLITHVMPLDEVQRAFEMYAEGLCPRIVLKLI